jgi:hypothetical protein
VECRGTEVHTFGTNPALANLEMIHSFDPEKGANSMESEVGLLLLSSDFPLP